VEGVQRQLQSKKLRASSVKQQGGLEETDLNEMMRKVQSALPLLLPSNRDIAVNITLSIKDLKILADSDLMVGAILSLVGSALHALPDGGALSLRTAQVDFTYQSIIDGSMCRYGACASVAITGTGGGGEVWWTRDKVLQTMRARKTDNGNDGELSTAYAIIKQHNGSIRRERVAGHHTTITVYLPLTSLNDVSQNALSATEIA
jgi:nitrogen-specific signal transduction histidine kinase